MNNKSFLLSYIKEKTNKNSLLKNSQPCGYQRVLLLPEDENASLPLSGHKY